MARLFCALVLRLAWLAWLACALRHVLRLAPLACVRLGLRLGLRHVLRRLAPSCALLACALLVPFPLALNNHE